MMIQHIVIFKFKESEPKEKVDLMISKLRKLEHIVDDISHFSVGEDYSGKSQGYQVALSGIYKSKEHLQEYYDHPEHLDLVDELKKVTDNWIVFDYKINLSNNDYV